MSVFPKDKDAVLDFAFDWKPLSNGQPNATEDWLEVGETISTYTVTTSTGITKGSVSEASGKVVVWLSGGTAGTYYTATCKIVTNLGRTDERTIKIYVTER